MYGRAHQSQSAAALLSWISHDTLRLSHAAPEHRSTARPCPSAHQVFAYGPTIHEGYPGREPHDYDIAVARFSGWSRYPPLRIQTPDLAALSEPGTTATLVGWGCTVSVEPQNSMALWRDAPVHTWPLFSEPTSLLRIQEDGGEISSFLRWAETTVEADSVCERVFDFYLTSMTVKIRQR